MSDLIDINNMLEDDFKAWLDIPTYTNKQEFTDKEDAVGCFKFCFEETYKKGDDRCLCGYVRELCDDKTIIKMIIYLCEKYVEEENVMPDINNHQEEDTFIIEVIHEYIYYYLKEVKYQEFITSIHANFIC